MGPSEPSGAHKKATSQHRMGTAMLWGHIRTVTKAWLEMGQQVLSPFSLLLNMWTTSLKGSLRTLHTCRSLWQPSQMGRAWLKYMLKRYTICDISQIMLACTTFILSMTKCSGKFWWRQRFFKTFKLMLFNWADWHCSHRLDSHNIRGSTWIHTRKFTQVGFTYENDLQPEITGIGNDNQRMRLWG